MAKYTKGGIFKKEGMTDIKLFVVPNEVCVFLW